MASQLGLTALPPKGSQLLDLARPPGWDRLAEASEDDLRGLLVELHVAAGQQERKLLHYSLFDVSSGASQQCPIAAVEPKLLA